MTLEEFEIKLKDKYPNFLRLLRNPNLSPNDRRSISYGLEIGPGWFPLVEKVIEEIEALNQDVECHQIKEKFGGLRIYVSNYTDEVDAIITKAEQDSFHICEQCSQPGVLKQRFWWRTNCEECDAKYVAERVRDDE